jgi:hypothetical protein
VGSRPPFLHWTPLLAKGFLCSIRYRRTSPLPNHPQTRCPLPDTPLHQRTPTSPVHVPILHRFSTQALAPHMPLKPVPRRPSRPTASRRNSS